MKKIILTEHQVENLVDKVIDEQIPAMRATEYGISDGRYTKKLGCRFNGTHRLTYDGHRILNFAEEIYGVDYLNVDVSYLIDIEHQPYGITDIMVYDIKGPAEIKVPFEYIINDNVEIQNAEDDDVVRSEAVIQLNWKKVQMVEEFNLDYFGLADDLEITIINSTPTQFTVKDLEVGIRVFKKER